MKVMELIGLLLFFGMICTIMERRGYRTTLDSLFFQVALLGGLATVFALLNVVAP